MANFTAKGQIRAKPFRDALNMELAAVENGLPLADVPKGSLRWNCRILLQNGDIQSIRELADRLDGKPAQAVIGGDDDEPAVKVDAVIRRIIVKPEGGGG